MRALSPRESRLVALLILVATLTLVALIVVEPVVAGFRDRAGRRRELAGTFVLNERRIAAMPALTHEAERQKDELHRRLLTAPDADEAAEMLRSMIEAAATASGADIKSTDSAGSGEDGDDTAADPTDHARKAQDSAADGWVRATVEAEMTHARLGDLLARLNALRPALVVDHVTIVADDALYHFNSDQIDVRIETSAPFLRAH